MEKQEDRLDTCEVEYLRQLRDTLSAVEPTYAAAKGALDAFAAFLAKKWGLGQQDRIHPDGRIERHKDENGEPP